jgi:class 3 adenylate cyclase
MKRKIAAILAADIAGYSRLVAEDEEETLRRLQAYREVVDDFIAKASGRIFNTAGDAVLAEFASAVEAVRCAIDIQESLRTRNRAYPPSRQMNFRIGITIGDVVERNGDLLGDGVNIAARLEGIAPVGGICVSRTVYEQVANKLSVQFADIGQQQVKNIPNPVHAFTVAMHGDGVLPPAAPVPAAAKAGQGSSASVALALAAIVVLLAAAFSYFEFWAPERPPVVAAGAPAAMTAPVPSGIATTATQAVASRAAPEKLVPDAIPIISDRSRADVRDEYMSAPGHKALAFSSRRVAFMTAQADDQAAANGALESCQRATDATRGPPVKCEVFAIGDIVVSPRAHPPVPPQPWVVHNSAVEKALSVPDIPLINEFARTNIERNYLQAQASKALALSPRGHIGFFINQTSADEASRRALEFCGSNAGVPCTIVAIDNTFVVPIPSTMKVSGFFRPEAEKSIAPAQRDDIARQLSEHRNGWSAVAVGEHGHADALVEATSESDAVNGAIAQCRNGDQNCRVIAIGMFAVAPN